MIKELQQLLLALGLVLLLNTNLIKSDEIAMPLCTNCTCSKNNSNSLIIDCSGMGFKSFENESIFDQTNYMFENKTYPIDKLTFYRIGILHLKKSFPKNSIKTLDLSFTSLVEIENGVFENMQEMQELILSHNRIEHLKPEVFKGLFLDQQDYPLRSLKVLRLDKNYIHTLNNDIFQHIDRVLEELYLNDNPLKLIDESTRQAITSLFYLKVLDLSNTGITNLPSSFLYSPQYLKVLRLSNNNISFISELHLEASHQLHTLMLNGNPIRNLSEENFFPNVTTLKVLHLCQMPLLEGVGKASLGRLENLEELHMSGNPQLRHIDQNALIRHEGDTETPMVVNLKKLYVANNQLLHLDLELNLETLQDLDIAGNPWNCECENQWLLDSLFPIFKKFNKTQAEKLTCAGPVEMEGRFFHDLSGNKTVMRCLDLYGNHPERDGTILVCFLLGLLLGIVLVLFIAYSYQRHWFGFFDNSPASFSRQFYGRARNMDEDL